MPDAGAITYRSARGRWVLLATILGSGMAFLDASVVNIALPPIGRDLHAGLDSLQWTINGYTLTLSGFLLLGGALGDRFGRRRVFLAGVIWFALASALCALSTDIRVLVAARLLQGVGGALLTPGSLAIIQAAFSPEDRAPAIGAWSGLGGAAFAVAPFLGGYLIDHLSWHSIFLINLPLALVVIAVTLRHVPETRDAAAAPGVDALGALAAAAGLAGVVYALTETGRADVPQTLVPVAGALGALALVAFVVIERTSRHPMLPLQVFRSRLFTFTNVVTFLIYGALSGSLFLLPIELQKVMGFSPLASGAALMPVPVMMLLLSPRVGRLYSRIGARIPMTVGPLLAALGLFLYVRLGFGASYVADMLPAILVFGTGLVLTVTPLTATALGALESAHAGIASAVNNDVARVGGLLAVAILPTAAGLTGADALTPAVFDRGFHAGIVMAAAACALGGALAFVTIRTPASAAGS
jgi:EmrB/QacA subfamily drug resistance transporter